MNRRLKKYMSILLTVSMAFMLMPSVVMGAEGDNDTTSTALTQVGGVLDFENGQLVGTVTNAPVETGPGSITVADFDAKVLRVQPPSSGGASYWWTLPLDSGE
ncbi:hypothetical protein J8340_22850, partial [Escherichia coli]|nr:hypothetical protein [Escherichia coli]